MGCTVSFICCEQDFLPMLLHHHDQEEDEDSKKRTQKDHSFFKPEELEALHSHTFREKSFKKSKHCYVCKQLIVHDGLLCRVCRIPCHKKCEAKVSSSCVPTTNYELVRFGIELD
ncbi:tensin-1-like [Stigmatopora argus]